jgi:triacylglycerol lipase
VNYLILVYGLPRITPSIDPGTVLFIHGGSLVEGYDRMTPEYARVCEPFVEAGVGCATMDYRVAPAHRWPAMPQDVASAVRWLKDNLASRGGNPERLFLFGHSSGCQLAAVVGANATYAMLGSAGVDGAWAPLGEKEDGPAVGGGPG